MIFIEVVCGFLRGVYWKVILQNLRFMRISGGGTVEVKFTN